MTDDFGMMSADFIARERDRRRPEMDAVVRTIDRVFSGMPELGIEAVSRGPVTWSWRDPGIPGGAEKLFLLTSSLADGTEGYPLLTIRQAIAPRLDSFITFSCLVVGPTEDDIELSLTTAIIHHTGAFGGIRGTMKRAGEEGLAAGLAFAVNIGADGVTLDVDDITSGRALELIEEAHSRKKGEMN